MCGGMNINLKQMPLRGQADGLMTAMWRDKSGSLSRYVDLKKRAQQEEKASHSHCPAHTRPWGGVSGNQRGEKLFLCEKSKVERGNEPSSEKC